MSDLPRHHSAEVRLSLVTSEDNVRLAQIGPHYVIVAKPQNLPPCDAEIVMLVDGTEKRWPVRLVEGLRITDRRPRLIHDNPLACCQRKLTT